MSKIIKNNVEYANTADTKVTQTASSDNKYYEVLFSGTDDNTTRTEGVRKTNKLIYNPANHNFANKCTSADASKTDNDVSSNTQYPMMSIFDNSNRITTHIENTYFTNGHIRASFLVRNYDTNGDQVADKGISMTMSKSGDLFYSISDPDNFRSAIGLGVNDISSQYTITKTSGNWKINEIGAFRSGNTIHMRVEMSGNGNSVSAGANGFVGTLSGGPLPVLSIKLIAFYNNCPIMMNIEPDGALAARVTATSVTVTSSGILALTGTFITYD